MYDGSRSLDMKNELAHENQELFSWDTFHATYSSLNSTQMSRFIVVETWTAPIYLLEHNGEMVAELRLNDGHIQLSWNGTMSTA